MSLTQPVALASPRLCGAQLVLSPAGRGQPFSPCSERPRNPSQVTGWRQRSGDGNPPRLTSGPLSTWRSRCKAQDAMVTACTSPSLRSLDPQGRTCHLAPGNSRLPGRPGLAHRGQRLPKLNSQTRVWRDSPRAHPADVQQTWGRQPTSPTHNTAIDPHRAEDVCSRRGGSGPLCPQACTVTVTSILQRGKNEEKEKLGDLE
jgi:hypothetical protein